MDKMFSKKAWCTPVAIASSTGLLKKHINTDHSSSTALRHPLDPFKEEEEYLEEEFSSTSSSGDFILLSFNIIL